MIPLEYPSDKVLMKRYQEIEQTSVKGIKEEQLVGNPLFKKIFRGNQWSIAAHGLVFDSSAGSFLSTAQKSLNEVGNLIWVQPEFLHITFTEVVYHPKSRKAGGISPENVKSYHQALLNSFPQQFNPIKLRLCRIIPTLDPKLPGVEGQTVSIVGAFITEGDDTIFRVKNEIIEAVRKANLSLNARLGGPPRVLFVTLGRFADAPLKIGGNFPLWDNIGELNQNLSQSLYTEIRDIKIISTSPLDYASPRGHIEVWPPIALRKADQIQASLRFLIPAKRLWYHRLQGMLGDK